MSSTSAHPAARVPHWPFAAVAASIALFGAAVVVTVTAYAQADEQIRQLARIEQALAVQSGLLIGIANSLTPVPPQSSDPTE
jgi:hypothetical protein